MINIDEKFKDTPPQETIKNIQEILAGIGVEIVEHHNNSGIDGCYSASVAAKGGFPASNGKGVTMELARASAYAEFIERLQCGLMLYKQQSIIRDPEMNLHTYAPDGKYMTMQELEENGEWMDYVIETYGGSLTRKKIAELCKVYACTEEDRILTLPFYSLFEDKYVYLPAAFIEQIYPANGCCAGNTKEEAWVHAFSEMMERQGEIAALINADAVPKIPSSEISKFPTATKILEQIRKTGEYEIDLFDISLGNGLPVIATRIINKRTQQYLFNSAADPVFEIAIHRTLTEIFQGRNVDSFHSRHSGKVLNRITDVPPAHNVMNQLETGDGLFVLDFFTDELSCKKTYTKFADYSNKDNKQLLSVMIDLYKKLNKPVYVRNYSFLGFCSYQFIVPGFSEVRGLYLTEKFPEYALGDEAAMTLRNVKAASDEALYVMLLHYNKIKDIFSRQYSFQRLSGIPIRGENGYLLVISSLAYANYRLKKYSDAIKLANLCQSNKALPEETRLYFACVVRYLELKNMQKPDDKIKAFLYKFFEKQYPDRLYTCLDSGKSPFDEYLLCCNRSKCNLCQYQEYCLYDQTKTILANAGKQYSTFINGQNKKEFTF